MKRWHFGERIEGVLKILTIKAKVRTDSLKEKQQALKRHHNFLISRPTIFYYKLHSIPSSEFNQTFIQKINKAERSNCLSLQKKNHLTYYKSMERTLRFSATILNPKLILKLKRLTNYNETSRYVI